MANVNTVEMAPKLPGQVVGVDTALECTFKDSAGADAKFYLPGENACVGHKMRIRAMGRVTGGAAAQNPTIKLYVGATDIATTGACALGAVSGNFILEAVVMVDKTSLKMQGCLEGSVNNVVVARALLPNVPFGLDLVKEGENAVTASVQFAAAHAGNAAYLDELSLDLE